ncbi:MAG TPA: polysaccharide biosynthesis tyrosine autokinase [Acidimicrobiales bacterium]|nr:polysaccharide biosynthesis tyrosine autokinase [Acidimicrobiales bacterium]
MDPELNEPDLRSYLGVLNRRKWWVVGVAAVFFAIAAAISFISEPMYRAKTTVQTLGLNDPVAVATDQERSGPDGNRIAQGELAYLRGSTLRFAAIDAVPDSTSLDAALMVQIRANPVLNTDTNMTSSVVELTLVGPDPDEAQQLLSLFASTYVAQRTEESTTRLIEVSEGINAEIEKLQGEIDEQQAQLNEANDRILDAENNGDSAAAEARRRDYEALSQQVQPTISIKGGRISHLESILNELSFGVGVTDATGASVLSDARSTESPVSPDIPLNLAIGLVFGLFLGVAMAFLRDYFDDSLKSKEAVERATGVPALGLIPRFDTADSELVTAAYPTAAAAEAFRSLRTSVKFLSVDRDVRVVQITSPSPGEGKTVVAANLATVFAQAGDRVVLVSGDLRRPRAEELLGVSLTPGLTGVLIGDVSLPQAIRPVDGLANLSVLPAGYPPPNPSELLSGERARRLIDVLAQTYDLVIIDCPPVLPVTDALVLARMADTTLLVTSANKTSRRDLDRAVELLNQVGAPLVGTVLTSLAKNATYAGETYGYESGGGPRQGYQSGISGYGNLADTGPMNRTTSERPAIGPPAPQQQQSGPLTGDGDGWQPDLPTRN